MKLRDRQARGEAMRGMREVRIASTAMEVRDDTTSGLITFRGLASRTATPYEMGWYDEEVARGAFAETLRRTPDLHLLVNHDNLPLARSIIPAGQPGCLSLWESFDGLEFEAKCDPTDADVARLAGKVKSGLMSECSFAFRMVRQSWEWVSDEEFEAGTARDKRTILETNIHRGDVSVCNFGANPETPVSARALLLAMSEQEIRSLDPDVHVHLARALAKAEDADKRNATRDDDEDCDCDPNDPDCDCDEDEDRSAEPKARVHSLDFYRARAFALRARSTPR